MTQRQWYQLKMLASHQSKKTVTDLLPFPRDPPRAKNLQWEVCSLLIYICSQWLWLSTPTELYIKNEKLKL